jgi:hypothetical protein
MDSKDECGWYIYKIVMPVAAQETLLGRVA